MIKADFLRSKGPVLVFLTKPLVPLRLKIWITAKPILFAFPAIKQFNTSFIIAGNFGVIQRWDEFVKDLLTAVF